jgi:hypothetical protein
MLPHEQLVADVAVQLRKGDLGAGARLVASFSRSQGILVSDKKADEAPLELLNGLVHWALNSDRYDLAAKLIWGDNIFSSDPHFTKLVWGALKTSASVLLLGGASVSKSYAVAVWLFLDWIRDPEYTAVRVVGPSEDHLKSNLFTQMVTLHKESAIPLPGIIGDLFIGLDKKAQKSSIKGIVIPLGKAGAGKLQGTKRVPRKTPHPIFGPLSRLRVFIDETEKVPAGVWKDVDNLFSQLGDGIESFKIIGACNPENPNGPTGQRSEPVGGWEKFDIENDERWKSKRGWEVVRLDPFKCENVITGQKIYPGLVTKESLETSIISFGGANSPSYYTYARGCFPPQGVTFSVINATALAGVTGEFIYQDRPQKLAAVDVALEGSCAPKIAVGRFGLAVGFKHPADYEHPTGREEIFSRPQWGLQLDQLFSLPNAETVRMANNIKAQCQSVGVEPGWLLLDRTGNGAGVHDLLKTIWSPEVRGINYSNSPTTTKIFEEDTKNCDEAFDRVQSELWFALARWLEFRLVKFSPVVDTEKLAPQLTSRLYMPGKVQKVESKPDYKKRGNESPDEADAVTLLLHCARMAAHVVPSMSRAGAAGQFGGGDDYYDVCPQLIGVTDNSDL